MLFNPKLHLADAPCYWDVANDGASWRCADCESQVHHSHIYYVLTPNGKTSMICKDCIDPDWLANATKMKGRV